MTKQPLTQFIAHLATLDAASIDSELKTTFGPFFKKYPSFKPVFESYAGLKGTEALTALQHRKTIVADDKQRVMPVERLKSDENYLGLNRAQTREVNALKMKQLIGKVVKRYNRAVCDDTGHPAKVEFKALPVAARIALLSFAWQHGPYFGGRHKDKGAVKHQYWQAFVCQDWQKAHDISYRNPMGRGSYYVKETETGTLKSRWYYETLLLSKLLTERNLI